VLDQYLREKEGASDDAVAEIKPNAKPVSSLDEPVDESVPSAIKIGDLCPECGEAAVVNEEGCRKCYACGYSEC